MSWYVVLTEDEYKGVEDIVNDMDDIKIRVLSSYCCDLDHPEQRAGRVKFLVFYSENDAKYVLELFGLRSVAYQGLELKDGYPGSCG